MCIYLIPINTYIHAHVYAGVYYTDIYICPLKNSSLTGRVSIYDPSEPLQK